MSSHQLKDKCSIARSANFEIFKPLYMVYTALGINSIKVDGKEVLPASKIHKVLCILVSVTIITGVALTSGTLLTNRKNIQIKNILDSLFYIAFLICVLLTWFMASFLNGKNTVKMIRNYCKVDSHLKVIHNLKPFQSLYLKILFFHSLTFLLLLSYAIISLGLLQDSAGNLWICFVNIIVNMTIQRFTTEIYMIILYIEQIARKIKGFSKTYTEKVTGEENLLQSNKNSNELNFLMNLYSKLSENSHISNKIICLPVIKLYILYAK